MSRRAIGWIGSAVTGALIIGLSTYFVRVGLSDADKLASVVGSLAGLGSLAVALWGLFLAKTPPRQAVEAGTGNVNRTADATHTTNVTAGRDVYLAEGDMTVNRPPDSA